VVTVPHSPFLVKTRDQAGADRYEGIVADLMEELATDMGFTYTFQEAKDGRYGALNNSDGTWSGMIGDVVEGRADIGAGDITITSVRETVVDFTHPFMYVGLGLIYTRGARGVAPPFESLEDLARQDTITVGTFQGGSTMNNFKTSSVPALKTLWERMQQNWDSVMASSNQDGVDKVLASNGGHVHVMESASIDYMVARNCRLRKIGQTFNKKSYGLALPADSRYREAFSLAILKLQESGRMEEIVDRWIKLPNARCLQLDAGFMSWIQGFF